MKNLRKFAGFLIWNVPLGKLAPHILAFHLGLSIFPDRNKK